MCAILGIDKTRTTPFHTESDGMVERMNQTLENMLSLFSHENQWGWDEHVPFLMMAYRSSTHETTKVSPNKMMLDRDINLPVDLLFGSPREEPTETDSDYAYNLSKSLALIHKFARERLEIPAEAMKKNYDHSVNFKKFNEGDCVWLHNLVRRIGKTPKLQCSWTGPYIVIKCLNDVVFRIQLNPQSKPKVVHYNRLKLYTGENKPTWFEQIPGNETDNIPESLSSEIPLVNTTEASEVSSGCETELPEGNEDFQGTSGDQETFEQTEQNFDDCQTNRIGRKIVKPTRFQDFLCI